MGDRLARVVVALVAVGCDGSGCPREGCDALRDRAGGSFTGIGGVVAAESDVVEDGCAQCGFSGATVEIYALSAPVGSDADASAVVRDSSPLASIRASERYSAPLDAGDYLVCVETNCVAVSVVAGAVTTVNVKRRFGPTSFFVADADRGSVAEDFGFDVSATNP